ncbi:MAG: MOSC domain-containing protein, partial [Nostocoides sp.]
MFVVRSVNVGRAAPIRGGKGIPTGIVKQPVDLLVVRDPGPKHGGLGSGVVGDFIGDVEHHGGNEQAVYAVAREELDWWGGELGRELPD